MTRHIIKYRRAKRLARTGPYHRTFDALWNNISDGSKDVLSARLLAEYIDAMRASHVHGRRTEWRENAR